MPESTLTLKKADFESKVGVFLGWGRGLLLGDDEWDLRKQAVISDCVESGLRQFYNPPILPGEGGAHDWSFLHPIATIAFTQGTTTIALPDDFGGIEGQLTITTPASKVFFPLPVTNAGILNEKYAAFPDAVGAPVMGAVVPLKGTTMNAGQRFELLLYPTADQDYTVQFSYYILANRLDGTHPYAYGGQPHVETILESCLAIAEQRYDDSSTVHSMKFMERLAASISADRRLKPQHGGYNGDRSDELWDRGMRHRETVVTYNGQAY